MDLKVTQNQVGISPYYSLARVVNNINVPSQAWNQVGETLRTFKDEVEHGELSHRHTMQKIIGFTTASIASGVGVSAGVTLLAGGVGVGSVAGAALLAAAGTAAGYALYRSAPQIVSGLEQGAQWVGTKMREAFQ